MSYYYNDRKRATAMLRQHLAANPRTFEELHLLVLNEFGFGKKFVNDFLELYGDKIVNVDGVFKWNI